jgi:hypothetical protein
MKYFHWKPSVIADMDENERAFVVAAIDKILEM